MSRNLARQAASAGMSTARPMRWTNQDASLLNRVGRVPRGSEPRGDREPLSGDVAERRLDVVGQPGERAGMAICPVPGFGPVGERELARSHEPFACVLSEKVASRTACAILDLTRQAPAAAASPSHSPAPPPIAQIHAGRPCRFDYNM